MLYECPSCQGTAEDDDTFDECFHCGGAGQVSLERLVWVKERLAFDDAYSSKYGGVGCLSWFVPFLLVIFVALRFGIVPGVLSFPAFVGYCWVWVWFWIRDRRLEEATWQAFHPAPPVSIRDEDYVNRARRTLGRDVSTE